MKYEARIIGTKEQQLIRKLAVQRVSSGETAAEVTRSFGLEGLSALCPKAWTGRNETENYHCWKSKK